MAFTAVQLEGGSSKRKSTVPQKDWRELIGDVPIYPVPGTGPGSTYQTPEQSSSQTASVPIAGGYGSRPGTAQIIPRPAEPSEIPATERTSGRQTSTYSLTPGEAQTDSPVEAAATLLTRNAVPLTYENAPSYTSKYQTQLDELTEALLNRRPFSYDPESDPNYIAYREQYTRGGQRAMENTLAQLSARTGGLASSYAGTAAQQVYDDYMTSLSDKIPELYRAAYDMYLNEGDRQMQNISLLRNLEGDSRNIFDTDYNRWYQAQRDRIGDAQSEYSRQLSLAQAAAEYGDYSGLRELGIEPNARNLYDFALASAGRTTPVGSGSGGGGKGGNDEDEETETEFEDPYDALFEAARDSGHPESFIANNYKNYGFNSSSGLVNDYKSWKGDQDNQQKETERLDEARDKVEAANIKSWQSAYAFAVHNGISDSDIKKYLKNGAAFSEDNEGYPNYAEYATDTLSWLLANR